MFDDLHSLVSLNSERQTAHTHTHTHIYIIYTHTHTHTHIPSQQFMTIALYLHSNIYRQVHIQ